MKMKTIAAAILMAAPLALTAFSSHAMERVTLKLAHNLDTNHVVHQALAQMAKEISTASDGKMKLRIYPGGQMGGPRETLELLQNGALDMTKASASEMEPFSPAFSIFSLPYLFKDQAHFNKVIYGPVGESMMAQTRDKGFVSIAAYVAGTRSFYANKPIHTPADMKGMKIRVVATPTTIKLIELLGAAPAPIPFGEVYTALQQGVIDGAENNEPSYVQTRHVEVAKFYAEDQHTSVPDFLVISSKVLDKLSDEQKAILITAAKHSETYEQELWDKEVAVSRKQATDAGATFIQVDKEAFRTALAPLYDDFRKDPVRGEWLTKIENEAGQ
ncbi:TRAP transporter substrate-binding protein [Aeromonas caviae]|uniref:TRAP transporter substrate-binding protein n=1 Tax=Aeromonas caviae TaxID=648 RepID=UPI000FE3173B|nr:TRAP transporter substrate-binding protein [Aeromonas caviae]MBS4706656.1 TRAP transporter substrate-binding protein [Aeromonas caviae]MDH0349868.1 TRAP transporter substrate-binding protein [Aeromonas caviae]RWT34393.1 TRAP transporter substrate-binding protein [Aeromonas caviae]